MVDRPRRKEAAIAQLLDRLSRRMDQVVRENAELRRWPERSEAARRVPPPGGRDAGEWE